MTETKKSCFVISPIGDEGSEIRDHADDVFEYIIQPALEGLDIEPQRADHTSESGQITEQMFRDILGADLCVAVLTGYNANVFYELAVAQCAARPLILLIEKGQPMPFDVKDLRAIEYRLSPISRLVKEKVYAKRMRRQVESLLENGWTARGIFEEYDFPELRNERQLRRMVRSATPSPLPPGKDTRYVLPSGQDVVVLTGDIKELRREHGIDAIVSLENTFLQLGRYFDRSISGMLRYMDAAKSADDEIEEDSLNVQLRRRLQQEEIDLPVRLGTVFATPTTQLKQELGVRYVLHVAAMHGSFGDGYETMDDVIDDCVRNAFRRFGRLARQEAGDGLESMLFPMLGAGTTDIRVGEVARRLLRHMVRCARHTPECQTIYVLAWLESHRHAIHEIAEELGLKEAAGEETGDPAGDKSRRPKAA